MQAQAEFIARQLNDHEQSKRGARQGTFHTWSEPHITEALGLAASYLFSILPDQFGEIKTTKLAEPSCHFTLNCGKVLDILGIGGCNNVMMDEGSSNNLLSMLGSHCVDKSPEETQYTIEKNGNVFTSSEAIPADVEITFICAELPDVLPESIASEHGTLITSFALWWLLLTDNESRTNLERAQLYYQTVKDYVELKLLLEFSLNEDDYKHGRRVVND